MKLGPSSSGGNSMAKYHTVRRDAVLDQMLLP